MNNNTDKTYKVIIAGVGGQGALTAAQLILGAAWKDDYHALQSEVHGMSQRGGAVNAHVLFDKRPVTSPLIMEGTGDLLISLEPLEALRYLSFLKKEATLVVSNEPIVNMENYPEEAKLFKELSSISNTHVIDTREHAKALNNKRSGNMVLLGKASQYLPISTDKWKEVIVERFQSKGDAVVEKNIAAFLFGQKL